MSKYMFLGYTRQVVIYEFEVNGEAVVISSNACRYEDAITCAELPKDAKLIRSVSFPIYDGKKNKPVHTEIIWAYRGTLPTGRSTVKYLVEKGCLTMEQASAIYDAEEVRL